MTSLLHLPFYVDYAGFVVWITAIRAETLGEIPDVFIYAVGGPPQPGRWPGGAPSPARLPAGKCTPARWAARTM